MRKFFTYLSYLFEYAKHGDFLSVYAACRYVIQKKTHSRDRVITTDLGQFYVRAVTNDIQYANPQYERQIKEIARHYIDQGYAMVLDIGACIGEFSIFCAKQGAQVFAFEPLAYNRKTLIKNLELNSVEAKVFSLGLGAQAEKANINFDPVNTGASSLMENPVNPIPVEISKLDSVFEKNESQHVLIKIDAEGMEIDILKGGHHFIESAEEVAIILEDKFLDQELLQKTINEILPLHTIQRIDDYNILICKQNSF